MPFGQLDLSLTQRTQETVREPARIEFLYGTGWTSIEFIDHTPTGKAWNVLSLAGLR